MRCLLAALAIAFVSGRGGMRGWNSYDDADGSTNAAATLAAAQYMSEVLLPHGFDLVTIDGGWSDHIDGFGRQLPSANLSTDGSLASLSQSIHALGLRFGVWTIRGIPKEAVAAKLPIWNSPYTADQAARSDTNCSWDADNMGVQNNSAGRACEKTAVSAHLACSILLGARGIECDMSVFIPRPPAVRSLTLPPLTALTRLCLSSVAL